MSRARLTRAADGTLEVEPFRMQDSSMMSVLAAADCLVLRLPHAPPAEPGAWVEIIPLAGAGACI